MEINNAAEILVIILSAFLALFLLLGIILTVYLIAITRQIKRITDSAEKAVGDIGSAVSSFVKAISPAVIAQTIKSFINKVKKDKEK